MAQHFLALLDRGHEVRHANQQELVYKVYARRNQLFARWAARLMGHDAERADAYAEEIVDHVFGDVTPHRLLAKVSHDLHRAGVPHSDERLREQLDTAEGRACGDVMARLTARRVVPMTRPLRIEVEPDVGERAARALHAIDDALAQFRHDLAHSPRLRFRDMFLTVVDPDYDLAAE